MKKNVISCLLLSLLLTGCGTETRAAVHETASSEPAQTSLTEAAVTETETSAAERAVTAARTTASETTAASGTSAVTETAAVTWTTETETTEAETETGAPEETAEADEEPFTETETAQPAAPAVRKTETSGTTQMTGQTTEKTTAKTTAKTTVTTAASSGAAETTTEETFQEEYREYDLSGIQPVLDDTAFIGDSIITGFRKTGMPHSEQVAALVGLRVAHALETVFDVDGSEQTAMEMLEAVQPKNVVCSFGLNDLNMETEEEFTGYYSDLLEAVRETLPDAEVYVLSITPVMHTCTKFSNKKIDRYNDALRAFCEESGEWHFIDVPPELKNCRNGLKTQYSRGDGIHLSQKAYEPFVWQICSGIQNE